MDWLREYKYLYLGLMLCMKNVMNSPTRIRNYDVDEFCDKLLSSDKFEKLIEKVADKAIEKISDIKNDHIYDSTENVKKSNRAEKTTWSHPTYHETELEPQQQRSKVNKISNLGRYSIAPLSDLSLQYKKFTKKSVTNKTIKPKEPSELKIKSKESKEHKSKESREHKSKESGEHKSKESGEHKSKESRDVTNSKESKDLSALTDKESTEVKDKRQYSDDDNYQHNERTEKKLPKKENFYKETKKHSIEKEKKETYKDNASSGEFKSESDDSLETTKKQPEKETELKRIAYHHTNATSKEDDFNKEYDKNYSKENAVSKSIEKETTIVTTKIKEPIVKYEKKEHHSEEKTHGIKQKEKHSIEAKDETRKHVSEEAVSKTEKQSKLPRSHDYHEDENYPIKQSPVLRAENGKVYTYQVSSEYDEYHEQLSKIKKGRRYSAW